ncbi:unnamed protein product [Brugia timori]|uniref:Fibronectin type-III domain-containing protein n=1 Tax=Brugia timori TaxID=42155 RepID=A0A0R3QAR1_9BILA|nr:unnamed protein product [Brugia timori]
MHFRTGETHRTTCTEKLAFSSYLSIDITNANPRHRYIVEIQYGNSKFGMIKRVWKSDIKRQSNLVFTTPRVEIPIF